MKLEKLLRILGGNRGRSLGEDCCSFDGDECREYLGDSRHRRLHEPAQFSCGDNAVVVAVGVSGEVEFHDLVRAFVVGDGSHASEQCEGEEPVLERVELKGGVAAPGREKIRSAGAAGADFHPFVDFKHLRID